MQVFVFKNKKKDLEKYPDYVVRDTEANLVGVGWEKTDKKGENYQSITLNLDEDSNDRSN